MDPATMMSSSMNVAFEITAGVPGPEGPAYVVLDA